MAKGLSPDQELLAIEQERAKLRAAGEALEKREREARERLLRQSNEALMAAFSKGKFGSVSKSQAAELARLVSTNGIDVCLVRLRG